MSATTDNDLDAEGITNIDGQWETGIEYFVDCSSVVRDWPVPTFHSSLLSRRYSILLCIEFADFDQAKLNIEVPIQIVIKSTHIEVDYSDKGLVDGEDVGLKLGMTSELPPPKYTA